MRSRPTSRSRKTARCGVLGGMPLLVASGVRSSVQSFLTFFTGGFTLFIFV